jgi:hypothetical protein
VPNTAVFAAAPATQVSKVMLGFSASPCHVLASHLWCLLLLLLLLLV